MPGLPGRVSRSLRAWSLKLIVQMPALEQIVEKENDHDRRRDAESDLRVMLFKDVRRMFAVTHRHPAFQRESDAATYDHSRDESPESHAEGPGRKHENFERKRRRQHGGQQQRPDVVTIDQVFHTRALLGAEFPEPGLP